MVTWASSSLRSPHILKPLDLKIFPGFSRWENQKGQGWNIFLMWPTGNRLALHNCGYGIWIFGWVYIVDMHNSHVFIDWISSVLFTSPWWLSPAQLDRQVLRTNSQRCGVFSHTSFRIRIFAKMWKFRWEKKGVGHILCECSFGFFLRFDLILAAHGTQRSGFWCCEMRDANRLGKRWEKQPK